MIQNPANVTIRKMKESDLAAVNAIDRAISARGRVTTWPFSFETYHRIYQPDIVLVAEMKKEIYGFVSGYIEHEERSKYLIRRPHELGEAMETRDSLKEEYVGWIETMGIRPDSWHRGIGTRLVEAFHDECKKNNATMRIIVKEDDKELTGFLQRFGFKKWELVTYEMPS